MCGLRFTVAGLVMLAVCAATGHRILYSPRQIALSAIVGLLLLMGGNLRSDVRTAVHGGRTGHVGGVCSHGAQDSLLAAADCAICDRRTAAADGRQSQI